LVDDLIERGYEKVAVLDISHAALDMAQKRLGNAARFVQREQEQNEIGTPQ
jgi:hypothetical protein